MPFADLLDAQPLEGVPSSRTPRTSLAYVDSVAVDVRTSKLAVGLHLPVSDGRLRISTLVTSGRHGCRSRAGPDECTVFVALYKPFASLAGRASHQPSWWARDGTGPRTRRNGPDKTSQVVREAIYEYTSPNNQRHLASQPGAQPTKPCMRFTRLPDHLQAHRASEHECPATQNTTHTANVIIGSSSFPDVWRRAVTTRAHMQSR